MAFMHQFNYKHLIGLLLAGAVVLGTGELKDKKADKAPSEEVQALDAKLLKDLQHQEIQIDVKTATLMECGDVTESELRMLFDINNVNYNKCESGNCHYTSYTIEGKLDNGTEVLFKLDSGEDGNVLRDLTFQGETIPCAM